MSDTKKENLLNIKDHIIFLGNRNDVYRLYNAMDVFVLPSRYEGLPVVGVEAQANGLPCVLSDKMTKETKITENTEFLSVGAGTERWAILILKKLNLKRNKNECKYLIKKSFSIKERACKLADFYMQFIN